MLTGNELESKPHEHLEKIRQGNMKRVPTKTLENINKEFSKGFNFIKKYKKAVSIMGSARTTLDPKVYEQATMLAFNGQRQSWFAE